MYSKLQQTISSLSTYTIPKDRVEVLTPLITYLKEKGTAPIQLNFICTHNSRRSHLAQIWAQAIAASLHMDNVSCYSGGTEATAMYITVGKTLENQGFQIHTITQGNNPVYSVRYAEDSHPVIGFSKRYEDSFNPTTQFAAIMTCTQADEGCPFIAGTEKRISIPFEDPKISDGTDNEAAHYEERSIQIAAELWYVFSKVNA